MNNKQKQQSMDQNQQRRRALLASSLGVSAAALALPSRWQTPILNSVLTPAHAQMSVCGVPIVSNVSAGPGSGGLDCLISFEVVSDSTDIEIVSITNSALMAPDAISYGSFGTTTSSSGTVVQWSGTAISGPSIACNDPLNEVTFTVTYNCAAAPDNQTTTLSLLAIAAMA